MATEFEFIVRVRVKKVSGPTADPDELEEAIKDEIDENSPTSITVDETEYQVDNFVVTSGNPVR